MQLKKFEGFIVDEKSYKETSKVLNIITKDGLKIGVVSKGCKKMKSNLRSVSQKFTYANFIISYKEDGLSTLISADIINPFLNIKKDIEKISYVNFITDLTNQVIKQSNNKNIYDILISSILKIDEGYDPLIICDILEIKYLDFLGISPYFDGCVVCNNKNIVTLSLEKGGFVCFKDYDNEYIVSDKTIKVIRMLKHVDIKKIKRISLTSKVKGEINNFIDEYYEKYTGLYLKSKDFLKNVVNLK